MVKPQTVRDQLINKIRNFVNIPEFEKYRSIRSSIVLPGINV